MSLITLLQTKQQRSTGLITDSLLQLKSFGYQRRTLACLTHLAWLSSELSCGLHQRLETLKVWASTAQVNKTLSYSYFSLVILVLADEIFAEEINICTHTHCSSHISMDDVRHVRDAINTWPHLIAYVTRLIQLDPEDHISRALSSAAAGHFLCICACVCVVLPSTNPKSHSHATAATHVPAFSLESNQSPSSQSCHDLAYLRQPWLDWARFLIFSICWSVLWYLSLKLSPHL